MTLPGLDRWKTHVTRTMSVPPRNIPMIGESTMNDNVWIHLVPQMIAATPALATAAPAYPPISACDELEGRP